MPQPSTAYWTPRRRLIAAGMLLAIGGFAAFVIYQGLWGHPWRDRPRADGALATPFNLSNLTVAQHQLHFGTYPDAIPALTDPKPVPVADAHFVSDASRVIGVTIHGQSRAYALALLNWHECVNDTLGEVPIAVIFCPLCDSASVVDRRLDDKLYTFGISGMLYHSNVLLYDHQDRGLWSQLGLRAISGPHAGRSLVHLAGWTMTQFGPWKQAHPDSTIVSFETGHQRDYTVNPYADYLASPALARPLDRLAKNAPVIGVRIGNRARAYPVNAISERLTDQLGERAVVIEADRVSGTVRVTEAPKEAAVVYTFWFAWKAFYPDTEVWAEPTNIEPAAAP